MLTDRLNALRAAGRRALVCYVTAGHPDRERSVELVRAVADAGADVIELGVPFSDPVADGPVIQGSSQRALEQGMTLDGTLKIAAEAKVKVPLVLMTYLNPLMAAGPDVLKRAHDAGISGLLATDLPVGEDREREAWIGAGPLEFIRLVAPTTPTARMAEIAKHGKGFVYLISRLGVTGARESVPADLAGTLQRLRSVCTLPICVGFGVSTGAQAKSVAQLADGVVVGSALVAAAEKSTAEAAKLVASMRAALDS
jgi:tryptophan synthase alpha chain